MQEPVHARTPARAGRARRPAGAGKTPDRPFRIPAWGLALLACLAAAAPAAGDSDSEAAAAPPASGENLDQAPPGPFRLVESWPVETTLDHPDIPDAARVWIELIRGARRTLDIAEFYASDDPAGGGQLKHVIAEIKAAARRGVAVRFLCEEKMHQTYPQIPDDFGRLPGIQVRRLDTAATGGGVMHAKYFIVDGRVAYIGSQNFDWRSLEHIQELGAVIDNPPFAEALGYLYEFDWEMAGRIPPGTRGAGQAAALVDSLTKRRIWAMPIPELFPPPLAGAVPARAPTIVLATAAGDSVRLRPAFSPTGRLAGAEGAWDEPQIVSLIDGARDSVEVQLLTYRPVSREGGYWETIENALRRAAVRGVKVRLLLSDWCKRKPTIDYLKSLSLFPGIETRLMVIPPWSGGFVPFARVCHAKYLLVDGSRFWIGTGNWERDYFHAGRNVGFTGAGRSVGAQLAEFFRSGWNSRYAERLRPEVDYKPPRISE